ncbi:MAG: phospholipase D-like domain-containing protein [Pseudomonadales bacterium]
MKDEDYQLLDRLADKLETGIRILDALVSVKPTHPTSTDALMSAGNVSHVRRSEALSVIDAFVQTDVLKTTDQGLLSDRSKSDLRQIQSALKGALAQKSRDQQTLEAEKSEVVLTRPKLPSKLDESISNDLSLAINVQETEEAFLSLASSAQDRLTIMTPFLDNVGAEWALALLRGTSESVRRELILRFLSDPTSTHYPIGFDAIEGDLRRLGVFVYDFAIRRDQNPALFETFHAKVVIADGKRAYVGSSNLTQYSKDMSMELGILVAGSTAGHVDKVIDKVRTISLLVSSPST